MALGKEEIESMRNLALNSSYPDKKIQLDLIDIIEQQQKENDRLKYILEAACKLLGLYCECPINYIGDADDIIECNKNCNTSIKSSDCYMMYLSKKFGSR